MSGDLGELKRNVQYLMDRTAILDCVNRYSRGVDRHDVEITASVYHDDALDEHGNIVNTAADYPAWVNALHSDSFDLHAHNITTHNCEIDGDAAHCESYVLYGLLTKDRANVWFGSGRYVDRLERRGGEWRIALRRTIIDWMFVADASPLKDPYYLAQGYPAGTHGKDDISYLRPLALGRAK